MKIPKLYNVDAKMTSVEEGQFSTDENYIVRLHRVTKNYKILKWFVIVNAAFLLISCILLLTYSLWSLYQLNNAMRSRDEAVHLTRYFNRYHFDTNDRNVSSENDSVIITDFHDWRKSILQSLEDLKQKRGDKVSESYNLTFLLHSIADTVKNFMDNNKDVGIHKPGNLSAILRNKLIVTNLTDFEIHILKEFTKLKILEQAGTSTRFRRTVRGGQDESQCNLQFSFSNNNRPVRVMVKPAKIGEGMINIKNIINDATRDKTDVRECSFNIVYEPNSR